jgi:hypothetical protein
MKKILIILVTAASLSSCMINEHTVGNGGQVEAARQKTVYIVGNRVSEVDSKALADGAENYTIDTRSNFVDMLINGLTFGVVNTRTVIIKK